MYLLVSYEVYICEAGTTPAGTRLRLSLNILHQRRKRRMRRSCIGSPLGNLRLPHWDLLECPSTPSTTPPTSKTVSMPLHAVSDVSGSLSGCRWCGPSRNNGQIWTTSGWMDWATSGCTSFDFLASVLVCLDSLLTLAFSLQNTPWVG